MPLPFVPEIEPLPTPVRARPGVIVPAPASEHAPRRTARRFVPDLTDAGSAAEPDAGPEVGPAVGPVAFGAASASAIGSANAGPSAPAATARDDGSGRVSLRAQSPTAAADRHPALAPLAEYLDDPAVTDVFVNGAAGLWVDRGAGAVPDPLWRAGENEVRDLATALIAAGNRHLDDAHPCIDVRLDEGIRVHAVLPPVSSTGTLISLRIPSIRRVSLAHLHARGMFDGDDEVRDWLAETARARANILLTGAAGSGKTTLLSALLGEASPQERIVTIEDVAELRLEHPHHVCLEARQANLEGAGEISLARLVREALRMRPDRLVVGECRGSEVRELLSALNTGHDGGAGTLHANGLADVPARLEALGALAGLDDRALARQAVSAFDLVLHLERDRHGARRLARVGALALTEGRLRVEEVTPWCA